MRFALGLHRARSLAEAESLYRYGHGRTYVERAPAAAGFTVHSIASVIVRSEGGRSAAECLLVTKN